MRHFPMHSAAAVVLLSALAASAFHPAWAAEEVKKGETVDASKEKAAKKEEQKFPKWDDVIKGAETLKGLFTLYFNKKEQKLLLEVSKSQYDKELIFAHRHIARQRLVLGRRHPQLWRPVDHRLPSRRRSPVGHSQKHSRSRQKRHAAGRCRQALAQR